MCPGPVYHAKKHDIDSIKSHKPVAGTVPGNIVIVDANGLPVEDSGTTLASIIGGIKILGSWNATTNSPALASGVGVAGNGYIVGVAGTTTLDGISDWELKDIAWFDGISSTWKKIDNTDLIASVFGRTGIVISANGDYTGSQITNVPAGTIAAITIQAAIDELDTEKATPADIATHAALPDAHHNETHGLDDAVHTGQLSGTKVALQRVGAPTIWTLQSLMEYTQSSGYVDGGIMTDGGGGDLDVTTAIGLIKLTNDPIDSTPVFTAPGLTISAGAGAGDILDDTTNYIYVDYNSGTPIIKAASTNVANGRDKFNLGKVFREGTTLHILQAGQNINEILKRIQSRENALRGEIAHASGSAVSDEGSEEFKVTAGVYFGGYTQFSTAEVDTSVAGDFEEYSKYATGWNETVSNTKIDIANWNDTSQASGAEIVALSPNRYTNRWIYADIDGHILVVLGQAQYVTLANCQAEGLPTTGYGHIDDMSTLVARITVREGVSAFVEIESAFHTGFDPATINNHNNLSGLDGGVASEYYHLTSAEHTPIIKNKPDVTLAGATPVYADLTGASWADGDRGMGIGTGGRIFMMYRYGATVKSTELS